MEMEAKPGIDPGVRLTQSAAEEVKSLLAQADNAGKTLRISVEEGGCSGLQYSMFFDEARPDDLACEYFGVNVVVDPLSAQYVQGAVVDLSDGLSELTFRISNPNARQSCGCGNSFAAQAK
jgi:iron-sulfur cluster assembly accessory protein